MLTTLKLIHIIVPVVQSLLQSYFLLLLCSPIVASLLISLDAALLLLYAMWIYSALHFEIRTPNYRSGSFEIDRIFQYRLNQERRVQLEMLIKGAKDAVNCDTLRKQYAVLLTKPSFCHSCEQIQPVSAEHCPICEKCIMQRRMHSCLLDSCVGGNNAKQYLSYLMIGIIRGLVMIATMLGLVIVKIDSVKGLAMAERWVLYLVLCVDLLCWQYMLREFAKLFRILRAEQPQYNTIHELESAERQIVTNQPKETDQQTCTEQQTCTATETEEADVPLIVIKSKLTLISCIRASLRLPNVIDEQQWIQQLQLN